MDRRGWPWKKKSSDKSAGSTSALVNSTSHEDQEPPKEINYVQISLDSYTKLTDTEEEVKILNEKLSAALSEMTVKDNLVKQHTKVAEEAVSGWEKAEAEAASLKLQFENLGQQKQASDDRVAHLDGALKECMKQIRLIKEESEQKMQELVVTKTRQWEKIKFEYDGKIGQLEQELLRASAENDALTRSLQERSVIILKMKDDKSQADAEIEALKGDIQSCEKEINSLCYEIHVISKELEIRNEEKNMSVKSADVANRQHLESVKKIAKLEAESQRLRGLVRKKLPGPAALAQMKLEVESLGRDHPDNRYRRSPARNLVPHPPQVSEFSLDMPHQSHKETEFLTTRLLTMEEETKMLKEALAKRNSELQAARSMCAKTTSKLQIVEMQMQSLSNGKSLRRSAVDSLTEGSVDRSSNPSMGSMSEDGIDDEASCAESWASALISELSSIKKEKNVSKGDEISKAGSSTHLELMDDFLEMEKACLSTESNGISHATGDLSSKRGPVKESHSLSPVPNHDAHAAISGNTQNGESSAVSLSVLSRKLVSLRECLDKNGEADKILEDVRFMAEDLQATLPRYSGGSRLDEHHQDRDASESVASDAPADCVENGSSSLSCVEANSTTRLDVTNAVSRIHNFIVLLAKEAQELAQDSPLVQGWSLKRDVFSSCVSRFLSEKMTAADFIVELSQVLADAGELCFGIMSKTSSVKETDSISFQANLSSSSGAVSDSTRDSDKVLIEEISKLKLEKEAAEAEFGKCREFLDFTRKQLSETEAQINELKLQLVQSQKSNGLAETQLKCMAESYKLLESRAEETEAELEQIKANVENLDIKLKEEQIAHQDALSKCKELQEQLESYKECSLSVSLTEDVDVQKKQDMEIVAAAEKLAECQETITILGWQLKALRAPEQSEKEYGEISHNGNSTGLHDMHDSPETVPKENGFASIEMLRADIESLLDGYNTLSDNEASSVTGSPLHPKRAKHRSTLSSSSSSPFQTPEKHGRAISRFFSRGKTSH